MEVNEMIDFANDLANEARIIARKYFRSNNVKALEKSDESPVTIADTEIEARIRSLIEINYPEHSIHGEEMGESQGNSAYKWYIDPIDGTSSFITGKPLFTTLICLTLNDEPVLSIIEQPILGERYIATRDSHTLFNQDKIFTSKCYNLPAAKLSTTSPFLFSKEERSAFDLVRKECSFQLYGGAFCGGDAYQYARLAAGDIDLVMESMLKPHDYFPLILIVKQAGGVITDWYGKELTANSNGEVLASANRELHNKVLKILKDAPALTKH